MTSQPVQDGQSDLRGFVPPLRVELPGFGAPAEGALRGLRLAVKDVIDVSGITTGAGNPLFLEQGSPAPEDAPAVGRLRGAGVTVIGKAHTDELAFSLSGTNVHYGTPANPAAPGRVPGGSSSGSASAVAGGLAQIALGTDTGGSIRVPASYCGVVGLRPTHGRVPLAGVLPLAPSFDTCGLLAADGELLARAGACLLGCADRGATARGRISALILADDLVAEADPEVGAAVQAAASALAEALGAPLSAADVTAGRLAGWATAFRGRQLVEAWRAHGGWIESANPPLGAGVAARFQAARAAPDSDATPAGPAGDGVRGMLEQVLPELGLLVAPATATVAPPPALAPEAKESLRRRTMRLTCIAGLAGAPALSLPLAEVKGLPAGVSLIGRPGDDELLLETARMAYPQGARLRPSLSRR